MLSLFFLLFNFVAVDAAIVVIDGTGSFHGVGDVSGPTYMITDLRGYEHTVMVNHDSNSLEQLQKLFYTPKEREKLAALREPKRISNISRRAGTVFMSQHQARKFPLADYIIQPFHGGRRVRSFDNHFAAKSGAVTIISDTMHGDRLDEVRKNGYSLYFNPPGIGKDRSGIVADPEVKKYFGKTSQEKRQQGIREFEGSPLAELLAQYKFGFAYGVHNELVATEHEGQSFQDQTKAYRDFVESKEHAVFIVTPNRPEDIRKVFQVGDEPTILTLDDVEIALKSKKSFENKVYFVSTGPVPARQFTALMAASNYPVLIEGNSSVGTALRLGSPFVMYTSLWNQPMIDDIGKVEQEQCGSTWYHDAYIKPRASDRITALLQSMDRQQHQSIVKRISEATPNVGAKISHVVDVAEQLHHLPVQSGEREVWIGKFIEDESDVALALSVLKLAHEKGAISRAFFHEQKYLLTKKYLDLDQLEAKFIPIEPRTSIKHDVFPGEQDYFGILDKTAQYPVRDLGAQEREYLRNNKVYISLTTSPERLDKIHYALKTIDLTNVEEILLTLPKYFGRNSNPYSSTTLSELMCEFPKLKLLREEQDYGPIMKMVTSIGYVQKQQPGSNPLVISIDDDQAYPLGLVNEFIYQSVYNPKTVIAGRGYNFPGKVYNNIKNFPKLHVAPGTDNTNQVDLVEGFGAIAYPANLIDQDLMKALSAVSDDCFKSDDLVISLALAVSHVPRREVFNEYVGVHLRESFSYGMLGDALHRGAGESVGDDVNHEKYTRCYEKLISILAVDPSVPSPVLRLRDEILQDSRLYQR